MISIPDNALILKDIDNEDDLQYRYLLVNQFEAIKEDWDNIMTTAERLHTLIFTAENRLTQNDKKIKERCCKLSLLEMVYSNWQEEG